VNYRLDLIGRSNLGFILHNRDTALKLDSWTNSIVQDRS
jgi:hypothetical protein